MTALRPGQYEDVEGALSATARGRAFLAEHARRARAADTAALLDAVARLERRSTTGRSPGGSADGETNLAELAAMIDAAKSASDADRPGADILDLAEALQDTVWTMRDSGFDVALCDRIDAHASALSTACTAQEAARETVMRMLDSLDLRIDALRESGGQRRAVDGAARRPNRPVVPGPMAANTGGGPTDGVRAPPVRPATIETIRP